jgi:sortase A
MKPKHTRKKMGIACMILGAALVCAALALFLWNQREASQADQTAQQVLEQVKAEIPDGDGDEPTQEKTSSVGSYNPTEPVDPTMTEVEIDGRMYIGYLSIPSLGLELPVQSQWSYPNLKISPCRYYGSTKTNDLVIAAHNYARHFGQLTQLGIGDLVYFTDMDGVVSTYQVEEINILAPTDVEEMTDGGYALTMFTCTYGGKSRVTVRCSRMEN